MVVVLFFTGGVIFCFVAICVKTRYQNIEFLTICLKLVDYLVNIGYFIWDLVLIIVVDLLCCCRFGAKSDQRRQLIWRGGGGAGGGGGRHAIIYNSGFAPTGRGPTIYHGGFGTTAPPGKHNHYHHNYIFLILVLRHNRHELEEARWETRESANKFGIPGKTLDKIYGGKHTTTTPARSDSFDSTTPAEYNEEQEIAAEVAKRIRASKKSGGGGDAISVRSQSTVSSTLGSSSACSSISRPRSFRRSLSKRSQSFRRWLGRISPMSRRSKEQKKHDKYVKKSKKMGRQYHSTFSLEMEPNGVDKAAEEGVVYTFDKNGNDCSYQPSPPTQQPQSTHYYYYKEGDTAETASFNGKNNTEINYLIYLKKAFSNQKKAAAAAVVVASRKRSQTPLLQLTATTTTTRLKIRVITKISCVKFSQMKQSRNQTSVQLYRTRLRRRRRFQATMTPQPTPFWVIF